MVGDESMIPSWQLFGEKAISRTIFHPKAQRKRKLESSYFFNLMNFRVKHSFDDNTAFIWNPMTEQLSVIRKKKPYLLRVRARLWPSLKMQLSNLILNESNFKLKRSFILAWFEVPNQTCMIRHPTAKRQPAENSLVTSGAAVTHYVDKSYQKRPRSICLVLYFMTVTCAYAQGRSLAYIYRLSVLLMRIISYLQWITEWALAELWNSGGSSSVIPGRFLFFSLSLSPLSHLSCFEVI